MLSLVQIDNKNKEKKKLHRYTIKNPLTTDRQAPPGLEHLKLGIAAGREKSESRAAVTQANKSEV